MVASSRSQHLILPIAPLAAAVVGVLTFAICALLPTAWLEAAVVDSGFAAILAAAEPPLGVTARAVLALLCGGGVALLAWFAAFLAVGTRSVVLQRGRGVDETGPVLRRADAHPDAPARQPVFANRDLGTPFLDVRASPGRVVVEAAPVPAPEPVPEERPLPVDLDQPLAAYDPAALPVEPVDEFPPPAQLRPVPPAQRLAPGERLETFALMPIAPPTPTSPLMVDADPAVTINTLLDRLERGVARREPEPARETLGETLSTLRKLATRSA